MRDRLAPHSRMVELLAAEKRGLLTAGWSFDTRDDPQVFAEAADIDRRRAHRRLLIQEMRDDQAPDEQITAVKAELDRLDAEWFELLTTLPAMQTFEAAWDRSWQVMVTERAWPHATQRRREGRRALIETKPEFRACFLGLPTAFQRYADAIRALAADEDPEAEMTGLRAA